MSQHDYEIDLKKIFRGIWVYKVWTLVFWVLISLGATYFAKAYYTPSYQTTMYLSIPNRVSLHHLFSYQEVLEKQFKQNEVRSAVFGPIWDANSQQWKSDAKTTLRPDGAPTLGEFLSFIDQHITWHQEENQAVKVLLSWQTIAQKQVLQNWLTSALEAEKNKHLAQLNHDLNNVNTKNEKLKLAANLALIKKAWPSKFNVGIEHQANISLSYLLIYIWLGVLCGLLAIQALWVTLREAL